MPTRSRSVVAFASIVVATVGVWIVSPRFSLEPSLVDDWSAIVRSPAKVHGVLRLTYHETGRFRPAFEVWNYAQWHTFGAPANLVGPNLWGIARLLLLVIGLTAFTTLLLRARGAAGDGVAALILAALPALLVITTPEFGVDLARFGPQEPALIGGMTLGGTLLFLGARELAGSRTRIRRAQTFAFLVSGYLLWLYGVYQKETSVCSVLLVPFLAVAGRRGLRPLRLLSSRRRIAVSGIAALAVLPILHVSYETAAIAARGQLVYQMHVQPGSRGFGRVVTSLREMDGALGSTIGWLLLTVVCVGILVVGVRRRLDWLPAGLLATAFATLVWSAQSGFAPSRYFMPMVALLAVALALQLASLRGVLQVVALILALTMAVISVPFAHAHVRDWQRSEQQDNDFVAAVASAYKTGCPVLVTGLDIERAVALPILVRLREPTRGHCGAATIYLGLGTLHPDPAFRNACLPNGRLAMGSWTLTEEQVRLTRCVGVAPAAKALVPRSQLR